MSFSHTAIVPALALLFAAGTAGAQENKAAAEDNAKPQASAEQKLPDGCQPSMAEMTKFLKLQANEAPTGEVSTTRHFNLAVYANTGAPGFARENNPGSWTLVGEVRDEGGLHTARGDLPKGSVCVLQGSDQGYPFITASPWFQSLHLAIPKAPEPAPAPAPAPKQ
jgi:hypothetical protein